MKKNSRLIKISDEIHKKALSISLDLSKIEGKKISIKEVIERPLRDDRVVNELKLGAELRKRGLK